MCHHQAEGSTVVLCEVFGRQTCAPYDLTHFTHTDFETEAIAILVFHTEMGKHMACQTISFILGRKAPVMANAI